MKRDLFFVYAYGQTDVGKKREHNEDNFLVSKESGLFIVADGMGGHAGGETASRMAVETIQEVVEHFLPSLKQRDGSLMTPAQSPAAKLLSDALRGACQNVHKLSIQEKNLQGMGTTTTALLLFEGCAFVAHVGDSRVYAYRDGTIMQLSEDHSLVNEQFKAGLITKTQAEQSKFRNIITRSIGFEKDVDVDMIALPVQEGDVYLLCTDGLTSLVSDEELKTMIENCPLKSLGETLIELANQRGGDDNITVIVVYISPKPCEGTEIISNKPKRSNPFLSQR